METPEVLWPENAQSAPSPAAPVRWVRWLTAGLILLVLAFVFHTKGRAAHTIQSQTRHWIATNTPLPVLFKHSPLTAFQRVEHRSASANRPPTSRNGWLAPMTSAAQVSSFGWHGSGSKAKFSPGVTMRVAKRSPIIAGVTGHVQIVGHQTLTIASGGYRIRWSGIRPNGGLGRGDRVTPATQVGGAASGTVTLEVTRDGYPVNPTMSTLYGTAWIHH